MKKKFPHNGLIIKREIWALVWALIFFGINSFGSADLDKQYELETIGALRSWDNMDGLFGDYVAAAYKEYFAGESRFVYTDLSKTDPILTQTKLPYAKVIHDPDILAQLSRSTHTQSLLRTKVVKENTHYVFTLEWLHAPLMEVMATLTFTLDEPENGVALGSATISEAISTHLMELFAGIPFSGTVTGRDTNYATVNIGSHSRVKKGDTLMISTLEEVKKHPLLKTIVDWELAPVGKVQVEQIEDGMAFCRIVEEEPGRQLTRYQKVTQVYRAPLQEIKSAAQSESEAEKLEAEEPPRLGWVGGGILFGMNQWQYSVSTSSILNTGGGLALGGKADGELWLTRNWALSADLRYAFWTFTQKDAATGVQSAVSQNGGVTGSLFSFKVMTGYTLMITRDLMGPSASLKLGFKSSSYNLPTSVAENTGPLGISSVMIGLGGQLPIKQVWGAMVEFDFRILSITNPTWVGSAVRATSDVEFFLGGYRRFTPRIMARVGLDASLSGVDFTGGASLSQNMITIGPSLLYYF